MAEITWLHLSDLHFGRNDKDRYNQNIILNDLIDDIKEQIIAHNLKIDLIFVTGDISFSGGVEDLNSTREFFKTLSKVVEIDSQNILFVPGNHDIVRSQELEAGLKEFKAQNSPNYISPSSVSPAFTAALRNYTSFVNQLQGRELYPPNDLFYETKRKVSGKNVSILGLNTAWSSGKDIHPGDVILGEYQVRKTLQKAEGADLIIALMHHPFSWLSEEDNQQSKGMLSRRSDFILTGHVHVTSDIGKLSIFGNAFCITSGALYDHSNTYSNSYNITTCNLESGTGTIYFRQYVELHGGFWSGDNTIDKSVPNGIVTFQLPSRIQIENADEQKKFIPTLPRQSYEKRSISQTPAPFIPNALIDDIRDGKCYLFAGAGASIDAGLPNWYELLNNGIDDLSNRVHVSSDELQELRELLHTGRFLVVADYLRYRLHEKWFGDYIKRYLSTKGRRSALQEDLSSIPFRIILTTNYDNFIERYRSDSKTLLPKRLMEEGFDCIAHTLDYGYTPIIKLHGSFDEVSSIVFGDSDYAKILYNSEKYRSAVDRLLSEDTCLFVGFGFTDSNILGFLQSIREKKGVHGPRHYAIMKKVGPVMERYYRENLNVEPIIIQNYAQIYTIINQIKNEL